MNPQFSVYLDLIRLSAAFTVFFSHLVIVGNPLLWRFSIFPGHLAVIIFFVLSGYVIAYVVFDKKETLQKFTVNRLTRIYSVVIPAMVLTYLSYWFVMENNPILMEVVNENPENPIWQFFSVFFMLHQSWQQVGFLTNAPIWSIAFEMFYYLAFAVLIYTSGIKRLLLIIAVVLAMGPNIALYFPLWLLGVASFLATKRISLNFYSALAVSVISALIIGLSFLAEIKEPLQQLSDNLINANLDEYLNPQSTNVIHDYLCAILLSVHFVAMFHLLQQKTVFSDWISQKIKKGSEMTFALYLLHLPLIYVVSAIFVPAEDMFVHALFNLIFIPILVYQFSNLIESNKFHLRKLLLNIPFGKCK